MQTIRGYLKMENEQVENEEDLLEMIYLEDPKRLFSELIKRHLNNIKKNALRLTVLLTALLCVTGCKRDRHPAHKVYGTDSLKVYEIEETNGDEYGKYRYSITDGTSIGWQLKTDSKFEIGDQLEIVKKGTQHCK